MKIINSLYMSALLIVAYLCLTEYKAVLESELARYDYVMKQISKDSKSTFLSNSSILKNEFRGLDYSTSKMNQLVIDIELVEDILKNPILLKSEASQGLLSKYGVNETDVSGQETLSTDDIYRITHPINDAFLSEFDKIQKEKSQLSDDQGFLIVDEGKKKYTKYNQYKLWFQKVQFNTIEKGYNYTITYDDKEEKVFQFPYLIQAQPDSLTVELDFTDQVTGYRRLLSRTFQTKDYQL